MFPLFKIALLVAPIVSIVAQLLLVIVPVLLLIASLPVLVTLRKPLLTTLLVAEEVNKSASSPSDTSKVTFSPMVKLPPARVI